jgi:hypothetical protein
MKKNLYYFIPLTVFIMALLFWGCSNNSSTTSTTADLTKTVADYFPLKQGQSADFSIDNNWYSLTTEDRFTVGALTIIDGQSSYLWLRQNVAYPARYDTGFIRYESDAVYFYANATAGPEKLLEAPFEVGHYWQRFEPVTVTIDDDNLLDDITDGDDQKNGDTSFTIPISDDKNDNLGGLPGSGTSKTFPTTGSNYMKITAIEDIQLNNGDSYKNCVCVENKSGTYTNYYWYAPGVGLVRYVLDATAESFPDGQIIGEKSPKRLF